MTAEKFGILIDIDRCLGCQACVVACRQETLVCSDHPSRGTIEVRQIGPSGSFPDLETHFLPTQCNHCEKPACLSVCPTGAIFKREDGIVLIDHEKCTRCDQCVSACPYGAILHNEGTNRIEKCTFCVHRLEQGEIPACIPICLAKARIFGDLNDGRSEISSLIKEKKSSVFNRSMPDGSINKSNVIYMRTRR